MSARSVFRLIPGPAFTTPVIGVPAEKFRRICPYERDREGKQRMHPRCIACLTRFSQAAPGKYSANHVGTMFLKTWFTGGDYDYDYDYDGRGECGFHFPPSVVGRRGLLTLASIC